MLPYLYYVWISVDLWLGQSFMIVSSFLSFSLGLYIYHQVKAKQKTSTLQSKIKKGFCMQKKYNTYMNMNRLRNREQNVNILLKKKQQFDPTLHIHIVSLAYKCTLWITFYVKKIRFTTQLI